MKILLVADEPGWIFERHCKEIQKRLTKHKVDIAFRKENIRAMQDKYDVIYVLDPIPLKHGYPDHKKTILGLRCEFLHQEHPNGPKGLYEDGFPGRCAAIKPNCSAFHVVNKNMYNLFEPIVDKPFFLAQHGVDEEVFNKYRYDNTARDVKDFDLRVGVAGRLTNNKGGHIILDAIKNIGVKLVAAQYGKAKLSKEDMPSFYQNIDIYVCMSKSEGHNNPVMEAGGMGVPVISSRCGSAEEIINDGENGFLIERNAEALREKILFLKNNWDERHRMGHELYNTVMNGWTWENRIVDFEKMFESI
tara:strand:+ start:15730 stop:16641 length:912 start_codon:yes stop_codon:yes gene_type:complete